MTTTTQPSRAELWVRFAAAAVSGMATEGTTSATKLRDAAEIADGLTLEFEKRFAPTLTFFGVRWFPRPLMWRRGTRL